MGNSTLLLNKAGSFYNINLDDVLYFESQLKKIKIVSNKTVVVYYDTLDNLLSKLDKSFERCHRSYVVNVNKIYIVTIDEIVFYEIDERIPVSKKYRETVIEALSQM